MFKIAKSFVGKYTTHGGTALTRPVDARVSRWTLPSVFVMPDQGRDDDDDQVDDQRPGGREHVIHGQLEVLVLQLVAQRQLGDDLHQAYDEYDAPAAAAEHRHLGHGLARVAVHARAYDEQCSERVVYPDGHEDQVPALLLLSLQLDGEHHQECHHRCPRGQGPLGQRHAGPCRDGFVLFSGKKNNRHRVTRPPSYRAV